ncbi:tryptophan-rich sensory protein [bacterium]|nr:tryptophan-rich sensory protein [bacterium]
MLEEIKSAEDQWKHQKITIKDLLLCSFLILICNLVGYISSLIQFNSIRAWYPSLSKSMLNPPNFVFPIVWSLLYILIGVSTCLSYKKARKKEKSFVIFVYALQLLFSFLWVVLFFGLKAPLMAFVEILFYIFIVLNMMNIYKRYSSISYILLYPYLFWIIFATYLNLIIIIKN